MAGQIIPKGRNKWQLRIYTGLHPETKARQYESFTFKGGKAEARTYLDKLIHERLVQRAAQPKQSVNQFLDQWLERVASNKYALKTFQSYTYCLSLDVRPVIGHIIISALTPTDVQRVFTKMREKGVCSNTRRRIYSILSNVLDVAVEWGVIPQNPAAQVQIPRREHREMRAMSREEVKQFLAVTDQGRWAEFFRTMVITGMRPGEGCALRWEDIDFERNLISVQRSLIWKGKPQEGWILVEPKTERGRRQISIPSSLTKAFTSLKKRQEEAKRKVGKLYEAHGFVFARRLGQPIYPKTFIRTVFKVALVRAELPKIIRLYDLRHTCATLLLKSGEHIKVVSERLGHANVGITLEIYVHVLPGMQEGAAARMESLLSDSDGTPEAHHLAHHEEDEEE
jgi:integrase